ncbi:MAG: 4-(cytidine 5'-diphospho)-2-C-methyl-D-erythritol kinase [Acidobacteria bacterium]|nr:4-(cytidine 5'-diphospho)-2-C-methyl-D-erythritol kinase [Acidobacteriota bacterium]MDA1233243.1 4-(cytidine 5'-diphospho)-2-C-methyl-D-erythritol kinase [Acidobacteriota bacterium]
MPRISGRAFAKVNLGLRILDRRPDGFHELRTVYQTISLADRIELTWTPGRTGKIVLHCNRKDLETPDNLVVQAAEAMLQRTGSRGKLHISLRKHVPDGAGLGGGSSDAAAALTGLSRLLNRPPAAEILTEIASSLGSDVPFFLQGGRAIGVSRGEEVYPLPESPKQWLLLLAPRLHSSTPEAYRDLAKARQGGLTPLDKPRIISVFSSGIGVPGGRAAQSPAGALANDFEETVFHRFPKLAVLKSRLIKVGARDSALSGSGSALFGLFATRQTAEDAVGGLGTVEADVFVVSTVTRRQCAAAWRQSG